ncbi:hypothetical protein B0E53_05525 [Micromonospora sp. MH33]|nr:hypothetical protein B0E53_05525 [Micromonospora sp. MH33]
MDRCQSCRRTLATSRSAAFDRSGSGSRFIPIASTYPVWLSPWTVPSSATYVSTKAWAMSFASAAYRAASSSRPMAAAISPSRRMVYA